MSPADIAVMPIWYLAFLFSTTCHEAAHAWVAKLGGDLTAYEGGQVSLDPLPHMRREPFGMLIVPIVSYLFTMRGGTPWMIGWASAPYDPRWAARYPRRAAWMALAGPAANYAVALMAALLLVLGCHAGWFAAAGPSELGFAHLVTAPKGVWSAIGTFFSILFSLNVLLGTFNLLPAPPLDGAAALPLILPERLGDRWREFWGGERGVASIGLIVSWIVFGRIAPYVWLYSLTALYAAFP